jgi:circadian clock protein KaiC
MMNQENPTTGRTTRFSTGISYLDDILGGGISTGTLMLIMGLPGSGKTTLASQIGFHVAHQGKRVLILTALSESTNKLIEHLQAFTFYDHTLIGDTIQFLSLQTALPEGLEATGKLIFSEARRCAADIVVLDGFRGMRSVDSNPQAAREFLYNLGTTLGILGTTTVITSETDPRDPTFFPETTTADIILGLHYTLRGVRQFRSIEVVKARMAAPMPGLHAVTMSANGLYVYPQLEERIALAISGGDAQSQGAPRTVPEIAALDGPLQRVTFDLPAFDAMLAGGIPRATCTLLAGSLGTGKTLLSLYYALAGVRAGETVVFLGFRESQAQLVQAAAPFELAPQLAQAMASGSLHVIEMPPIKVNPDVLADQLLQVLDTTKAQRLVIDSVAELERGILRGGDAQRLEDYLAALLLALRLRQVTALLIKETDKAMAATLDFSADALSVLAENVLLLQQVPYQGALHRILSILKLRFSDHDTALREFRIRAPEGLQVLATEDSAAGVLAGITQQQEHTMLRQSSTQ